MPKHSSITIPLGFRAAGGTCGIKVSGKPDLALIASDVPCQLAAAFTTNQVCGAPIVVSREHLYTGRSTGQALVINSGCSNVATGERGITDAGTMCATVAEELGCPANHVLPASTGVIGQHLPIDKITRGIRKLVPKLSRGPKADAAAATAILTTDLRPKTAHRSVKIGRKTVNIGGIAKGSGMIAPNMATMLAFITTDVVITHNLLRRALRHSINADGSFNRITVDSDTSTSDTVVLMCSGLAKNAVIHLAEDDYQRFFEALCSLCQDLAYQIIKDGEGVQHVIRVIVEGARSDTGAVKIARTIADSPLVKTAVHGGDPNWGRIAAAAGRASIQIDPNRMTINIGNVTVFQNGQPTTFSEKQAAAQMKKPEVVIHVSLGLGEYRCEVLGCDLSREYIAINSDYTT